MPQVATWCDSAMVVTAGWHPLGIIIAAHQSIPLAPTMVASPCRDNNGTERPPKCEISPVTKQANSMSLIMTNNQLVCDIDSPIEIKHLHIFSIMSESDQIQFPSRRCVAMALCAFICGSVTALACGSWSVGGVGIVLASPCQNHWQCVHST